MVSNHAWCHHHAGMAAYNQGRRKMAMHMATKRTLYKRLSGIQSAAGFATLALTITSPVNARLPQVCVGNSLVDWIAHCGGAAVRLHLGSEHDADGGRVFRLATQTVRENGANTRALDQVGRVGDAVRMPSLRLDVAARPNAH